MMEGDLLRDALEYAEAGIPVSPASRMGPFEWREDSTWAPAPSRLETVVISLWI
jgi:hypothetical protein